jgi:hypothetical protein
VEPQAPEVEAYVAHLEETQEVVAAEAGVAAEEIGDSFTYALNGFEAELTTDEVAAIERKPEVAKVVPNELRQLQTDASPSFLGIDAKKGAWASGYVGEDVVVGVIDSGIWPEHASLPHPQRKVTLPVTSQIFRIASSPSNRRHMQRCGLPVGLLGAYSLRI